MKDKSGRLLPPNEQKKFRRLKKNYAPFLRIKNHETEYRVFNILNKISSYLNLNQNIRNNAAYYYKKIVKSEEKCWRIQLKKTWPRTEIQIHRGNYSRDTTCCILVGTSRGDNYLNYSQKAMDKIKELYLQKKEELGSDPQVEVIISDGVSVLRKTISDCPYKAFRHNLKPQTRCKASQPDPDKYDLPKCKFFNKIDKDLKDCRKFLQATR